MRLKDLLPGFIAKQWEKWFNKVEAALIYFTPTYVPQDNSLFSPLVAVVALIASIFLLGLAIGSFFTLFTSLLVLYFILTKVFGIRFDMMDVVSV